MKRKWLVAGAFVAVVAVLVWANLQKAGGESKPAAAGAGGPKNAPVVKVAKLEPTDLTQRVMAPGTLEASGMREIRSSFTTPRVRLLAGAGDRVTEGQVIAELESDDLRVQVAAQEAAVARAEAGLAQLRQQQQSSPTTLAMKMESARAQLAAAEAGLQNALKQASTAQQRVEQARVTLLTLQNRSASGNSEVTAARQKLQTAEAEYRANPLSPAAQAGLATAEQAYQDALRRSTESARQISAELAQAHATVQTAEKDLADSGETSPGVVQARSQLESARLSLQAAQADAEAGGVSAEQLRATEADLTAQRANLENLRKKLEQASLKAPATGTILSVGLKDGQPAQQGQLLYELGGMDRLTLKARVDEVDVGKVKVGQALSITSNAHPGQRFEGSVTRVAAQAASAAAGASSGTGGTFYEVQGDVQNPEAKLRSGMTASARVVTETRKGVLAVGLESVREEGEKASVLIVVDYKVKVQPVTLGLRNQTRVEVLDGLKAGDEVIVAPFTLIQSLQDGAPVRTEVAPQRGDEE